MLKVVIDTSVFVAAYLSPAGVSAKIIDFWREGHFELLTSDEILDECFATLFNKKIGLSLIEDLNKIMAEKAVSITSLSKIRFIARDPDDDKFVNCALSGGAAFLLSWDNHLLSLKRVKSVQIVAPPNFLKFLK